MSETVDAARDHARKAHWGQVDKLGVDYMVHVEAVAEAVAPLGEEAVVVALLHDVVEDCANPALSSLTVLIQRFGPSVGAAVEAMTKRDGENYLAYLARVRANSIAHAVKTADIAHNVSRIPLLPDMADRARLLRKYGAALSALATDT